MINRAELHEVENMQEIAKSAGIGTLRLLARGYALDRSRGVDTPIKREIEESLYMAIEERNVNVMMMEDVE